ncbi:MAG TPA: GntR family transcriptional regulator [Acidobacteriaceae bacterium]|nr:GntR family transcriptional regulator [Acidobacteriaceae bacterium]
MLFRLNPTGGQPLYLQLMEQIRHAIENGSLQHGDQLPGIRTLAQELVVSPTTIAKAYAELEHEGLLDLRQGSGAFISATARLSEKDRILHAKRRIRRLVEDLRQAGLRDDEVRRIFEAELLSPSEALISR